MQTEQMSRRSFIEVAAAGAAIMAAGTVVKTFAVEAKETKPMKIFVCGICGHVEYGAAPARCPVCGALQEKFMANDALFTESAAKFKEMMPSHAPEVTIVKSSKLIAEPATKEIMVRIGTKLHPMEEAHLIRWIDAYVDDKFFSRISLTPGSQPGVVFFPKMNGMKATVVAWCNLHGYWQAEATL
jgi:desulfoferrodoxin